MSDTRPVTVICTYRVRPESVDEFLGLLDDHGPLLRRLGLVTDAPARRFRGRDRSGRPVIYEMFQWREGAAAGIAHEEAEVAAVWGRMERLVEERGGQPRWEFVHGEPLGTGGKNGG